MQLQLLNTILSENELYDKLSYLFNMDESGLKLNNRSTVLAAKRSKNVLSLTSGEKEETIWIIARCNVEEMFLPSFSIFKGKDRKKNFWIPTSAQIIMSEKSAYVNATIFKQWLESHVYLANLQGLCF
mgnify:CR=1 FL=1